MTSRRAFSVSVFPVHEDRVLLIRHKRLNAWLPPGGEVEENETPLEAARRELTEETGLEGDFAIPSPLPIPGAPEGLVGYEEHEAGAKGLHLNFVFVARVTSRTIASDGSFTDHAWLAEAPEESPVNVREGVRLALRLARSA